MLLTALSVITCVQFVVGGNRSGAELSHKQNGDCWVCLCWLCLCVNLRLLLFGAIVTHTQQQWVWLASLWWSDVSAVTELMSVGIPSVWEKEEQVLTESCRQQDNTWCWHVSWHPICMGERGNRC